MYKTIIIQPYPDATTMMMQSEIIPETGTYEILNSTPSRMDDTSAKVLGYRSYLLSMYVVFILKDIIEWSISFSGGGEYIRNGSLNVVDFSISS